MKKFIGLLFLTAAITSNAFADGWTGNVYIADIEANSLSYGHDDGRFTIRYSTTKGGAQSIAHSYDKFDQQATKANFAAALTAFTTDTPIRLYLTSNNVRFRSIQIVNQ